MRLSRKRRRLRHVVAPLIASCWTENRECRIRKTIVKPFALVAALRNVILVFVLEFAAQRGHRCRHQRIPGEEVSRGESHGAHCGQDGARGNRWQLNLDLARVLIASIGTCAFTRAGIALGRFHVMFANSLVLRLIGTGLAWSVHEPKSRGTRYVISELVGTTSMRTLSFPLGLYRPLNGGAASRNATKLDDDSTDEQDFDQSSSDHFRRASWDLVAN